MELELQEQEGWKWRTWLLLFAVSLGSGFIMLNGFNWVFTKNPKIFSRVTRQETSSGYIYTVEALRTVAMPTNIAKTTTRYFTDFQGQLKYVKGSVPLGPSFIVGPLLEVCYVFVDSESKVRPAESVSLEDLPQDLSFCKPVGMTKAITVQRISQQGQQAQQLRNELTRLIPIAESKGS